MFIREHGSSTNCGWTFTGIDQNGRLIDDHQANNSVEPVHIYLRLQSGLSIAFMAATAMFFTSLLFLFFHFSSSQETTSSSRPLVPAAFIFGDSIVDCGNNNYLLAAARGDQSPNGIDFPGGKATGRFSNGRTVIDVVGELLGLPLLPPYLDPSASGSKILHGLNYASGAAGIIDETGGNYAQRVPFSMQIQWFQSTIAELSSMLGREKASELIAKSLIGIIMGSNDYINNYFLPYTQAYRTLSPAAFQEILLKRFSEQIKDIYELGARKIFVANLAPLGCIPSTLFLNNSTGGCIESVNSIVTDFNRALKPMLRELNTRLPGATLVYGDVYKILYEVIQSPADYGFEISNTGCCGAGPFHGQVPCLPFGLVKYCPDRSKYVFWDPYHPTDAADVLLARRLFDGDLEDVSPVNLRELCAK